MDSVVLSLCKCVTLFIIITLSYINMFLLLVFDVTDKKNVFLL